MGQLARYSSVNTRKTMTDTLIAPGQVTGAAPNRLLWAAVGLLGATSLVLGAALWNKQEPASSEAVVVAQAQVQPPAASASGAAAPAQPVEEVLASTPKKVPAPAKSASEAMKNVVIPVPKVPFKEVPAPAQVTPAPAAAAPVVPPKPVIVESSTPPVAAVPAPVAVPVCANCGIVQSVTPFQREAAPTGAGAAAGAVIGGVLGNQVGGGNGKTLATILGAVGGGWAGNTVEKKMKQETHYRVQIRMEDGSLRTVEQSTAIGVGERVTVDGATLRPAAPGPTSMTIGLRNAV
jgi:uncharacterized protein YcfJ